MKALVTGSAGFIGRHFASLLLGEGWEVVGADLKTGCDCRSVFATDHTFDLVIHCAADLVGDREQRHSQPFKVAGNIGLDAAMFEWAMRTKPTHVVYFSSCALYGHFDRPIREEDACPDVTAPDDWYGTSKLVGEVMAKEALAAGLNVHIVRPFSGYGSDQSADYPFGAFVERINQLHHTKRFEVWGDGQAVRDWVHVDDIIGGVMEMVDKDVSGPLNIGTGKGTTFDQLALAFVGVHGYPATFAPPIVHLADKPSGIPYRVADTTLLHQVYRPKITLAEGIHRALYGE